MAYSLPEFGHDDWQVWAHLRQLLVYQYMTPNKPIAVK